MTTPLMPRREPRILAGRPSRAERKRRRADIDLEDASLSRKTRARYMATLIKLTPWLDKITPQEDIDDVISEWVDFCWKSGEPLLTVGDGLSALHFYQPGPGNVFIILGSCSRLGGVWRFLQGPHR